MLDKTRYGTGLPNDVDFAPIELKVLEFLANKEMSELSEQ